MVGVFNNPSSMAINARESKVSFGVMMNIMNIMNIMNETSPIFQTRLLDNEIKTVSMSSYQSSSSVENVLGLLGVK